jgi:hypothetical protein
MDLGIDPSKWAVELRWSATKPESNVRLVAMTKTYSQNFVFVPVKHMRHETSVGAERLPCNCISKSLLLLSHVPDMISLRIHDNIFIRLFEATK